MAKPNKGTPGLANWILAKLVGKDYLEEFLGDLQEINQDRREVKGPFYAHLMYWLDAIHLAFGFYSYQKLKNQNNNNMMIKTMLIVAWRNAIRQKQSTTLNVIGLTIGVATCLMIGLYVHNELSFDRFHSKGDRIYRINQPNIWGDWSESASSTGPNVAVALQTDAPEFEEVTRMLRVGSPIVNISEEGGKLSTFKESRYYAAEHNFFQIFDFELIKGDPVTSLKNPRSMVVSEETARKYFGNHEAMGRSVEVKQWDGSWDSYTITGVIEDVPTRSHIQFDILVSLTSYQENMDRDGWKWIWTAFSTYGLVKEGTDVAALTEKLQLLPPKWAPPTTERIFNQTFEEFTAGNPWKLEMQPMNEIYSGGSPEAHGFGPTGNPLFVKIFAAIGMLVLVLSAINFMNLSTARSSNRGKEVGIRKVLGSRRKSIIGQFIFESILFVSVGTVFAFILVEVSLDVFNQVAEKELSLLRFMADPLFWLVMTLFVLGLGLVSGIYPAFYLSSFKPIETIKGKIKAGYKGSQVRNGLVVFQFTISIVLVICAFFVQKQLSYSSNVDLGFEKDNILQIHNIEQLGFDTEVLKNRLQAHPACQKVGKSFGIPPNVWSGDRYRAAGPDNPVVQFRNIRLEEEYLEVLGVEIIAGRNFDLSRSTDKYHVLLNEEAVKLLGWGQSHSYTENSPIGKKIALASGDEDEFEVIGVVNNFNFNSVKEKIEPLVIIHHQNDQVWDYGAGLSYYSLKLDPARVKNTEDLSEVIEDLESELASIDPTIPFEFSFLDGDFESTFRSEQRMAIVLNFFTIMAIVIACLGLFGLSAFAAEQRVKELGIRKVLGAKVTQLAVMFSKDFTRLIVMAIVVAIPVAYFLVDNWLGEFEYRTSIDIWVFIAASLISLVIAILTVSFQSVKVASTNPVESLKDL